MMVLRGAICALFLCLFSFHVSQRAFEFVRNTSCCATKAHGMTCGFRVIGFFLVWRKNQNSSGQCARSDIRILF